MDNFCWGKSVAYIVRKLVYIFTILFTYIGFAQSSVLSTGKWYKVGVTESGIFKLDRSDFLDMGINVDAVDPSSVKIYGNAVKGILPQANSVSRPSDLVENAILVQGENDGSFDAQDHILFYAVGPDENTWTETGLRYEKNIYSDTAYYFINVSGDTGKRISDKANLEGTGVEITSYSDFIVREEDINNILNSGRGWYGELYSSGEIQTFNHAVENLTSDLQLILNGIGQSSSDNIFSVTSNGNEIGVLTIDSIPSGSGTTYSIKANQAIDTFSIDQTADLDLQLAYEANSATGRGFLNYYLLLFKRSLRFQNAEMDFRTMEHVGSLIKFRIENASGITIWDVTDPTNVSEQLYDTSGNSINFQSQSSQVEEFVAFSGSDFPAPFLFEQVSNQNIRSDTQLDGIIVSHPDFYDEAERLALFHSQHGGLRVEVVSPVQIYNEFSSGRQDVTAIRDYVRHVYNTGGTLKYLLLFGDSSFDYKYRRSQNTNFVPTYESRESFHPIFSYSSDDFYGFLEDGEGDWMESVNGDHTLEIGIGRLPAKTKIEAETLVDKIIYYSTSPRTLGKWRNEIAYLADDGDANIHACHAEKLSKLIDTTHAQYNIDKLLLDAFDQEAGASAEFSPSATKALKSKVKNGAFAIDFIGHGNESLWTEEEVLTKSLIRRFTNIDKMPIFVTATCEFGRHDDPGLVSGAEELLLNDNGGAIALLTTSRPVFASTNFELNLAFHKNIFKKKNGEFQRLGDIIRATKNEGLHGPVNRNFTLLGDPMLMPAYPKLDIQINELLVDLDTLSALEEVTFTGSVQSNGAVSSGFNGRMAVSVFDIEQSLKTKGHVKTKGQESTPFVYTLRNNALFQGESSVTNGIFSFTFVVPKNISYQFKNGKISLYAWDEERNIDASGASSQFILGGTLKEPAVDTEPPDVQLYLNDETFVTGTTVGSSSLLIANIEDENGISLARNGLSQGITLHLNGERTILNDFYSANLDTYQRGTVMYPMQDLEPGSYVAILNVYDTYNNLTKREIHFLVSDESFISVFNPKVYPNPVSGEATFSFEHDHEEEDLEMLLLVYNTHGEVMSKTNFEFENSDRLVELQWQARTNSGQLLNRGIYFYRLIVKSRRDGAVKEISNKLVIVN